MRKSLLLFIVMISAVLFSTAVFAAAWNVPTNVRIVQKSNIDNTGRIYSSIQQAINSITNASATNPYVVKVMPGIYDLGTASLQMKAYVDVEGSGPDNTIIMSSNNNIDGDTCTIGTVLMANNSSIRHIKVVNMPQAQNGNFNSVAAVVFNNVKAKAEGISVLVGSDTVDGGRSNGICSDGEAAHAVLNNVNVETHNAANGQSNQIIMHRGGSLTLTNSKLVGFGSGAMVHGINSGGYMGGDPGIVTVINSTIEGTSSRVESVFLDSYKASISHSTMIMNVGTGNGETAIYLATGSGAENFSMVNSKIISDGIVYYTITIDPAATKFANSLLPGDISGLAGAKLVNNYDENFDPIPNQ